VPKDLRAHVAYLGWNSSAQVGEHARGPHGPSCEGLERMSIRSRSVHLAPIGSIGHARVQGPWPTNVFGEGYLSLAP
jgi:hypothetical protein